MFVMAVVTSFAFRSVENSNAVRHNCVWFIYTPSQTITFASLAQAQTPSNWQFVATEPNCGTPTNRLCAICVPPSEVYANADGTADDTPKVDVAGPNPEETDAHAELINAFNAISGWSPATHPNGTLIHIKIKS